MSIVALKEAIQQLVKQQLNSANLCDYSLGVVETINPLTIRIDQKELLTEEFLILTDLVRDFDVDITVNHTTENKSGGSGYALFESHNHAYSGRKKNYSS